ncbi:hypothetical protein JX265_011275 [Neoarthrinium moseri]|uniref:Infection structure specific protein n=1 Tax=Neoarthrinium moseri TaxID=1658444 RepID=A0A9P9WCA8_9PEZI|nr:hypothetical protein JX265_011275 [Neoarthrinium moseri]
MLPRTLLLLVPATALASASNNIPPRPADAAAPALAPRQTDNLLGSLIDVANKLGLSACLPQALPLVSELPRLPRGLLNADLISQALSQTTLPLTGVCGFSVTGDVGAKFTAFLPTLYGWYGDHSATIAAIVASGCPSASALVRTVEAYESCSQVPTARVTGTGTGGTAASETGTESGGDATFSIQTDTVVSTSASSTLGLGSGGAGGTGAASTPAPSSSVSQAQAPRQTGLIMTAVAAAGFLGAVAAL